jgi:hypothetical protein
MTASDSGGVDDDNDIMKTATACLGGTSTKTTEKNSRLCLWRLAPPAAESMMTTIDAGQASLQPPLS